VTEPFVPTGAEFDDGDLPAVPRARRPPVIADAAGTERAKRQGDFRLTRDGRTVKPPTGASRIVATGLVDVLVGASADAEHACLAFRLIAPAAQTGSDDACTELWRLSMLAPPPVDVLGAWWVACRSRKHQSQATALIQESASVPEDIKAALLWVMSREGTGIAEFCSADRLMQAYYVAIRACERDELSFPTLNGVLAAIRAGKSDLGLSIARLPGAWSAAALRDGRLGRLTAALDARQGAISAGVDLDFPQFVAPRFKELKGAARELALDLLAGLPGVRGASLTDPAPTATAALLASLPAMERVAACQRLIALGSSVEVPSLVFRDWVDALGAPSAAADLACQGSHEPGAMLYAAAQIGDAQEAVVASMNVLRELGESSNAQLAVDALLSSWVDDVGGRRSVLLVEHLLSEAGVLGEIAEHRLAAAMIDGSDLELSLFALTRSLETWNARLALLQEAHGWQ
jgi:hypothetical protein